MLKKAIFKQQQKNIVKKRTEPVDTLPFSNLTK